MSATRRPRVHPPVLFRLRPARGRPPPPPPARLVIWRVRAHRDTRARRLSIRRISRRRQSLAIACMLSLPAEKLSQNQCFEACALLHTHKFSVQKKNQDKVLYTTTDTSFVKPRGVLIIKIIIKLYNSAPNTFERVTLSSNRKTC